jgi:integrase/recombinase XerD
VSPLRESLADYLDVRRALGFRLDRAEKLIGQFLDYLEEQQASTVTIEHAVAWATAPAGAAWWHALRLSAVRPFASWLHAQNPAHEVPPHGLIPHGPHRAVPYVYSAAEISALAEAARCRPRLVSAATYPALIGVLAATGARVGEAIALDDSDFDASRGILTVRDGKLGKSRLLPLHPTSTAALERYQQERDRLLPARPGDALLVSSTGTRLDHSTVSSTFRRITAQAGITARSAACRPRIHDLRHSFAVASLLKWYRHGDDVQALLPRLSTYLGHSDPRHPYWYLSAAPELLALAGERLEAHLGAQHDHPGPDPAGVLHRPADPAAPGKRPHDRRLPRHLPAPAGLRRAAERAHALRLEGRRPGRPAGQRVP